jgi:ArsR family metal-binding transcriptional regulator
VLLKSFSKEMFRPKCNHNFQSVHCVARLDQDISEALPYVNTTLGGSDYVKSPPALTLRVHGKLITLHAREIFINALEDENEADGILESLKNEINDAWEHRFEITPTYDPPEKPKMIEILRLLPKTNCGKCGRPTCTVFAIEAAQGLKDAGDCPDIAPENKRRLADYLGRFQFDV